MPLLTLLITLVVLVIVGAILWWAFSKAPLASPFKEWLMFIVALIFAIVVLYLLLPGIAGGHSIAWPR